MATKYSSSLLPIYTTLSSSISKYNSQKSSNTMRDVIDDSGNLLYLYTNDNPPPNLRDAMLYDTNYNLIHQNIIYILGIVTAATLFTTILIVGKR